MADAKITQLAALGAFASGDLIPMVDDPSGIPETKKATINQVQAFVASSNNAFTGNNYFTHNLGIGSTSPVNKFEAAGNIMLGATGAYTGLAVEAVGISVAYSGMYAMRSNAAFNSATGAVFHMGGFSGVYFHTGDTPGSPGTPKVVIDASGNVGIATTTPSATLTVNGSVSKSSGSFDIPHPLPALAGTHRLIHSFVESPTADNIYRGKVALVNGQASINIDSFFGMTDGTFSALNGSIQVFLQNDSGWDLVRGSVDGNVLSIVSQNQQSTDVISWLVIGERQDQHMLDTQWTDEFGRPILEPLNPVFVEPPPFVPPADDEGQ